MWGRLSRAHRREAGDRLRQEQELRQLRYLRDEIFARPDIARMYWHVRHPDALEVLKSGEFERIAEAIRQVASETKVAEPPEAGLIREFLDGLAADERAHLISQLGTVFRSFQRIDLADRLAVTSAETPQKAAR